jgi:hypothetical protein
MPDTNLIKLRKKNYLCAVRAVIGTQLFRSIWVFDKKNQREFDALEGGDGSCAYVVSGVLYLHGLIDAPHATVATTVERMHEYGWRATDTPIEGDIVQWPAHNDHMHIGFYLSEHECISNNSKQGIPVKHGLTMQDGRTPMAFYTHDLLRNK